MQKTLPVRAGGMSPTWPGSVFYTFLEFMDLGSCGEGAEGGDGILQI